MGATTRALRVLIFGSCVSRDILNEDSEKRVELVAYYARSSFASAFSDKSITDVYSRNLTSAFQQRMVNADLEKKFPDILRQSDFDILLIDFVDERFNLFLFDDGEVCTLSNEFLNAGFDPHVHSGEIIVSGTARFFELWETGWRRFINRVDQLGLRNCIRINKVYWAEHTESGVGFLPNYSAQKIKEANDFLERIYIRVADDLDEYQFLTYRRSTFVGSDEHRWGKSPFHYVNVFYKEALTNLLTVGRTNESNQKDIC